jgi:hypothetical protein
MTATNEAWISDSLARLEQLEAQREHLARAGRTDALAELDEEIKSLYEVLESAAENDDAAANSPGPAPMPAPASVPHPAFGPTPYTAPVVVQAQSAAFVPVAEAPVQYSAPAAFEPEVPAFAPAPSFSSSVDSSMGDDEPSGGKGAIIAVVLVLLLGGGAGAYWFLGRTPPPEPAAEPTGPAKVIQAGAIPDDTQEPDVAKGGEADRTPSISIKGPPPADDRRPSGPRPSGSSTSKPAKPEKGRPDIKVDNNNNDPLAGVR